MDNNESLKKASEIFSELIKHKVKIIRDKNTSIYFVWYVDPDVKNCLEDSVLSNLNIPIIYDADISHKSPCLTIINGSIATINVKDGKSTINFELK